LRHLALCPDAYRPRYLPPPMPGPRLHVVKLHHWSCREADPLTGHAV